jgi:hypothetical protein
VLVRECIGALKERSSMLHDQYLSGGCKQSRVRAAGVSTDVEPKVWARIRIPLWAIAKALVSPLIAVRGRRVLARLRELDDRQLTDIGHTCGPNRRSWRALSESNHFARSEGEQPAANAVCVSSHFFPRPKSKGETFHVPVKPIYFIGC